MKIAINTLVTIVKDRTVPIKNLIVQLSEKAMANKNRVRIFITSLLFLFFILLNFVLAYALVKTVAFLA